MIENASRPAWRRLCSGLTAALDLVLPPRCLGCGGFVAQQGEICADCWPGLRFLHPPWCAVCGRPVPADSQDQHLTCEECHATPPAWEAGRSAIAYDEGSKRLILAFKHRDRIEAAGTFSRWMARAGADLLAETDLVLPVPIHRWRLLRRGYNQAGLLAARIARTAGLPWHPSLLRRVQATASQQALNARQRQRNVTAAAFAVPDPRRIKGRRILLVDDVLTTGATLGACVTVLQHHDARSVRVLTLARVVSGPTPPIS